MERVALLNMDGAVLNIIVADEAFCEMLKARGEIHAWRDVSGQSVNIGDVLDANS